MEESSLSKRYGLSEEFIKKFLERLPLPLALVFVEEIKNAVEEHLKDLKIRSQTRSFVLKDQVVDKVFSFLSLEGRGKIRELVLISDSPSFNIYIEVDGRSLINHSFNDLAKISELMEDIDVVTNDYYVVRVANISFLNKASVVINPQTKIVLKQAFVLYDLI